MNRLAAVSLLLLALGNTLRAQEAGSASTLTVSADLQGRKLKITGSVDLPDGTILQLALLENQERVIHHKLDCRIEPLQTAAVQEDAVEVRGKKFTLSLESASPRFYTCRFTLSRYAQRDMAVLKALLARHPDWVEERTIMVVETKGLVELLAQEQARLPGLMQEFATLADSLERFLKAQGSAKEFAALEKRIEALERKVAKGNETTAYRAATEVLSGLLTKMRGCAPSVHKLKFAPGSADAEHLAAGSPDIPEGVNDEWQMELIRAYLRRARAALDRERFLIPLRHAIGRWDEYVARLRAPVVDLAARERAFKAWESAVRAVEENATSIEEALKDKGAEIENRDGLHEWSAKSIETARAMNLFVIDFAVALAPEGGQPPSKEREDEVRRLFDALNTSLRRIPAR